nr:EamA family transporter [Lachnospiraceae bacterium]
MSDINVFGIALFLFSVFISSCSQIILKKSANIQYDSWIKEYLNVRVISAYGIFFLSSFLTMFAYKYVPLSIGPMLETCGYIFVAVLGVLILKEKISKRKFAGMALIIAGVVIVSLFG